MKNTHKSKRIYQRCRCDNCGRFFSQKDFVLESVWQKEKPASYTLISVDAETSDEDWETLCKKCNNMEISEFIARE